MPGKFRNYNDKKILVDYSCIVLDENKFLDIFRYDVDNDSIIDVVEISPTKIENDSVIFSPNPIGYCIFLNDEKGQIIYDPKMDGWNQNEELVSEEEFDYSKINL